jgi:hypothetical protein
MALALAQIANTVVGAKAFIQYLLVRHFKQFSYELKKLMLKNTL